MRRGAGDSETADISAAVATWFMLITVTIPRHAAPINQCTAPSLELIHLSRGKLQAFPPQVFWFVKFCANPLQYRDTHSFEVCTFVILRVAFQLCPQKAAGHQQE